MKYLEKKYIKILLLVSAVVYIFIMTTPSAGLEEENANNELYSIIGKKVVDIMNTEEKDIPILQDRIDDIRSSFEELKNIEGCDEVLQNTINTWSSHTDKVQSNLVVDLDTRIDKLKDLDEDERKEALEKIKIDIEALRNSDIEYPREQGNRLLERLEIEN